MFSNPLQGNHNWKIPRYYLSEEKDTRKVLGIAAAVAVFVGVGTLPALAWDNAGGGLWDHGSDMSSVWSNYYHRTSNHGSTAAGNEVKYSGCKRPTVTSHASAPLSWYKTV